MKSSWMWGLFVQAQLPFIVLGFSVIVNNYFVVGKKTFPNECVRTMCVAKNMLHVIIIKNLFLKKKKRKKKEIGTATPIFRLLHCSQAVISNLCRVNGGICTTRWSHSHTAWRAFQNNCWENSWLFNFVSCWTWLSTVIEIDVLMGTLNFVIR